MKRTLKNYYYLTSPLLISSKRTPGTFSFCHAYVVLYMYITSVSMGTVCTQVSQNIKQFGLVMVLLLNKIGNIHFCHKKENYSNDVQLFSLYYLAMAQCCISLSFPQAISRFRMKHIQQWLYQHHADWHTLISHITRDGVRSIECWHDTR